jgi:hypothetical protein
MLPGLLYFSDGLRLNHWRNLYMEQLFARVQFSNIKILLSGKRFPRTSHHHDHDSIAFVYI